MLIRKACIVKGDYMGLFDSFNKKKVEISNDSLVSVIAKTVLERINEDYASKEFVNFQEIHCADTTVEGKSSCVQYWIEPSLSYFSNNNYFGWIYVWDELKGDTQDKGLLLFLVKISNSTNEYKTLFSFNFDDYTNQIGSPSFENIKIVNHENGLDKCLNAIKNNAIFNDYKTPPPYFVFASMIK
jgi:hypothetical protein